MRAVRVLTGLSFGPAARSGGQPWLPGLPHVLVALAIWPALGAAACVTGLLLATMASFVVFLPLTALALNGGRPLPADAPPPVLPVRAQLTLFVLWSLAVWVAAALAAYTGG
ncbi:hypothetical protein [Rhodopila sp.]|jgi:hypothetical protein|uniref:hypothetical protein n=1 Tax=Rhodopila sp. TaxID=2480087 RepID=UPI002BAFD586|nr:hypothetical protein [Rhodopila sp.]HVZ06330.1 hypothetical protein [Rhodopila sp.]